QHRHRENPWTVVCRSARLNGRREDVVVAVDGDERSAAPSELPHGGSDGLRHVEQFEVDEDLLAAFLEPLDQFEVASGHEQFEADLVEDDAVLQVGDERLGFVDARNVERENQPLTNGNRVGGEKRTIGHEELSRALYARLKRRVPSPAVVRSYM